MAECEEEFAPSIPNRRRSSFFQKRDSLIPSQAGILNNENQIENDLNDEYKMYLENVKKEFNAWKTLYKERKIKRQEIEKKLKLSEKLQKLKDSSFYEFLSSDMIEFLKTKPDIDEIIKSSVELCEEFKNTEMLYNSLMESNQRIIEHVKNTNNEIIEGICNDGVIREDVLQKINLTIKEKNM